jgi:hypothetical protein
MFGDEKIPEKLEPVHIDEVMNRLRLLKFTRSLPWSERTVQEQHREKLYENLSELFKMRERIDAALRLGVQLSHKGR